MSCFVVRRVVVVIYSMICPSSVLPVYTAQYTQGRVSICPNLSLSPQETTVRFCVKVASVYLVSEKMADLPLGESELAKWLWLVNVFVYKSECRVCKEVDPIKLNNEPDPTIVALEHKMHSNLDCFDVHWN